MPSPASDRLADAVAELYAGGPESFTARRASLVREARTAGDRSAAQAIGALRRPTRVAWVVNTLARAAPDTPAALARLATGLREAQQAKDGQRLRELSAERGELIDTLTARALSLADVADAPPALRLEVSQTLTAALADPGVAAQFASGALTRSVQWSGFGVLSAGGDEESGETEAPSDAGSGSALAKPAAVSRSRPTAAVSRSRPTAAVPTGPSKPEAARTRSRATARRPAGEAESDGEAEQRAAEAERRAEEARRQAEQAAAERTARRREQYAEAEQAAAVAAATATAAGAAEDRLEGEVRDLEQRLTRARAELATARMRARRAETAERRSRQEVDRLPRDSA